MITDPPPTSSTTLYIFFAWGGEPGNMTLLRHMIFDLVLFRRRVTEQEVFPAGQRQSGAVAGKRFLVLYRISDQDNTAVHQPSAKYYQLLGLHGRRWRKWRKIGI